MGRQTLLEGVDMSFFEWFLFFIAVALFLILFVPFSVRIKLHNVRDDSSIAVEFKLLLFRRLCIFTLRRSMGKKREKIEDDILRMLLNKFFLSEKGLPRGKQMQIVSNYMMRVGVALYWHEMMVLIKIGTGDAASTGINIGLLRSLGGVLSHFLRKNWRFSKNNPLIQVYPYFLERKIMFYITTECSTGLALLIMRVLFPSQNKKEVARR